MSSRPLGVIVEGKAVELEKRGKQIWWIVIVVAGGTYLYSRRDSILVSSPSTFDVIILLTWIALLLSPLFSELDLFGLKLRNELQDLKQDVNTKITDLRADIHNSLSLNATINPSFHFPLITQPSSDSELERLDPHLKELLYDTLKSYGVADRGGGGDPYVAPDTSSFLFGVRYNLEKRLRNIWNRSFDDQREVRSISIHQILNGLVKGQILDPELVYMIREVYSICSASIHGEDVTEEQVRFVRSNSPSLYAYLDAIVQDRNYA